MTAENLQYGSWEEWVDRDERDLSIEGTLEECSNGLRVSDVSVDELLRPWAGKRVQLGRRIINNRLVLTVVELA